MENHKPGLKIIVLSLFVIFFMTGCEGETPQTPNERTEELIRSITWKLTSFTVDGVASDRYAGMTLQFGTGIYTSTGGDPVWPVSGTWVFEGKDGKKIKRDDGLMISVEKASAAEIILAFDWSKTTYISGRVNSLPGRHFMTFQKKP